MLEALLLTRSLGFALVVCRVAGFVLTSPFPGAHVSATQRVGLVVVLSWLATSFAPVLAVPHGLGLDLFVHAAIETGSGIAMGVAFRMLFFAGEVLGQVVSHAVGLSSPSVLNPTIENEDAIMARLVSLVAMLLVLAVGAHRIALAYLLESFRVLPVGSDIGTRDVALRLIDLAVASFVEGVRIGLPMVGVALVVQLALGMIARAAPALQIFSVGLSVILATGFLTLVVSLGDFGAALVAYDSSLPSRLDEVLGALGGRGP
jgi:flagellar biosynthetic protein FliR